VILPLPEDITTVIEINTEKEEGIIHINRAVHSVSTGTF